MTKNNLVQTKNQTDPRGYADLLTLITKNIEQIQLRAAISVIKELTKLHWTIGKILLEKNKQEGWGAKVVAKLAHDLNALFPGVAGFSERNLRYMKKFAESYPDENTAAAVAVIPWGHTLVILEKIHNIDERLWYIQQTLENNWSRSVLSMWIESDLYKRKGKAITNFQVTLPSPHSDLAEQTLKDPYCFDFLMIDTKAREREIELGLMSHMENFLLELGQGFAFMGRQRHIVVGTKDFYIDMLFYHTILRCYIVVELKAEEFDTRDIGRINLYLSAIDSQIKHPDDQPTIGLLLCKSKDNYVVEYALRNLKQPVGVASYVTKLVESLPKKYKGSLPSIKEIEAELEKANISQETTDTNE